MGRSEIPAAVFVVALALAATGCGGDTPDPTGELPANAPGSSQATSNVSDAGCRPLFDGESLAGWHRIGDAELTAESGMIIGRAVHGIPNSFLATDDAFGDFDLSLAFNVDEAFNSGVQFRSEQASDTLRFPHQAGNGNRFTQVTRPGRVWGYQADIDPTSRGWTANIYEEAGRGWLQTFPSNGEPAIELHPIEPGAWHALRIRAAGDTIQTWLDGDPVATLVDTLRSEGFIALQVHAVGTPEETGKSVRFRSIEMCGV